MRQITKNTQEEVIAFKDINPKMYYGADLSGQRGIMLRKDYYHGKYSIISPNGLTIGNGWDTYDGDTLDILVDKVQQGRTTKVFQFSTFLDLVSWVTTGDTVKATRVLGEKEAKESLVNTNKFYGVADSGHRGFITRDAGVDGRYSALTSQITVGGRLDVSNAPTLETSVQQSIKYGASVYEFDSFLELMSWVTYGK